MNLCVGIESLAIPVLILRLGGETQHLALLGGLPPILYVAACFLLGPLGDRYPPGRLILIGALGYGLFFLPVSGIAGETDRPELLWVLYLLRPLAWIFQALLWPAIERELALGQSPRALNRLLRWFNISWSGGTTLGLLLYGPLVNLPLGDTWPWMLPFVLLAACGGVSALLAPFCFPGSEKVDAVNEKGGEGRLEHEDAPPVEERDAHLASARMANFAAFFVTAAAIALFPELAERRGIDEMWLSLIVMLRGATELAVFVLLGSTERFLYRPRKIQMGLGFSLAGALCLALGPGVAAFMAGFLLMGFGTGITYVAAITYSLRGYEDKSAKGGIHEGIIGLSFILGPLACGYAGVLMGLRAPYWAAAVLPLAVLVLLPVLRQTRRVYGRG